MGDGSGAVDSGSDGGNHFPDGAAYSQGDRAENLCLAGGVALNCVANGQILREGVFEKIWIQPAAGDAGGALGAALFALAPISGKEPTGGWQERFATRFLSRAELFTRGNPSIFLKVRTFHSRR